jgi:1-acyl-sn-glycerol-3-phosphate acyltransferase
MVEEVLPGSPICRKIFLWILSRLLKLLFRFELTCVQNIPSAGPLIVVINHIAFLDPLVVVAGFPRAVTPVAKQEVSDHFFFGLIARLYGVVPVRRGEVDLNAVKRLLRILKEGEAVLIAPEGTRSPTCQMQLAKDGATMLALRSEAIIVPVGIIGTDQVRSYWLHLQRAPVRLMVGQPFRLCAGPRVGRTAMAEATVEVMYRLAAQLPPEFRGVYSNLEAATEKYLAPVE